MMRAPDTMQAKACGDRVESVSGGGEGRQAKAFCEGLTTGPSP